MLEGDWVMRALYGQAFCSSRPKILVIMRIGPYKMGTREGGPALRRRRLPVRIGGIRLESQH